MNIYIPIEIKVRELEGRTILALAAAERGHTVVIGEKKDTIGLAAKGKLPPGIVLMKSITPHDHMLRMLERLKKNGHSITSQDEESGLLDESYDTFARLRYSEESLVYADAVFGWGEHDSNSLKKIYPEYSDLFKPVGSPRVDYWRKEFAGYFEDPDEEALLDGKPYIMVVSNFGTLLNENRFWNVMARLREAGYFDRKDNREFHEYENFAYQTGLVGEFIKMIRHLSEKYPEMTILVRPHPVESVDGWEKLIGDRYPNVVVNREGTISRWIRNSLTIIHNGCTSALEAYVSEVNCIAYRPRPHHIEREIPNRASIQAMNLDELTRYIDEMAVARQNGTGKLGVDSKTGSEFIEVRFANLKGKFATDRIVNEWEKIADGRSYSTASAEELLSIEKEDKVPVSRKIKRNLVKLRNLLITPKREESSGNLLETGHKFPDLKEEELSNILKNLNRSLSRFNNVEITRFGEKSFIVHPSGDKS